MELLILPGLGLSVLFMLGVQRGAGVIRLGAVLMLLGGLLFPVVAIFAVWGSTEWTFYRDMVGFTLPPAVLGWIGVLAARRFHREALLLSLPLVLLGAGALWSAAQHALTQATRQRAEARTRQANLTRDEHAGWLIPTGERAPEQKVIEGAPQRVHLLYPRWQPALYSGGSYAGSSSRQQVMHLDVALCFEWPATLPSPAQARAGGVVSPLGGGLAFPLQSALRVPPDVAYAESATTTADAVACAHLVLTERELAAWPVSADALDVQVSEVWVEVPGRPRWQYAETLRSAGFSTDVIRPGRTP